MAAHDPDAQAHLERAADMVWEAIQRLEEAQRILFKAGDCYVSQVYGDGVRAVIEVTEDMAEAVGDLTQCHIEIGRIGKRDKGRGGWQDS